MPAGFVTAQAGCVLDISYEPVEIVCHAKMHRLAIASGHSAESLVGEIDGDDPDGGIERVPGELNRLGIHFPIAGHVAVECGGMVGEIVAGARDIAREIHREEIAKDLDVFDPDVHVIGHKFCGGMAGEAGSFGELGSDKGGQSGADQLIFDLDGIAPAHVVARADRHAGSRARVAEFADKIGIVRIGGTFCLEGE